MAAGSQVRFDARERGGASSSSGTGRNAIISAMISGMLSAIDVDHLGMHIVPALRGADDLQEWSQKVAQHGDTCDVVLHSFALAAVGGDQRPDAVAGIAGTGDVERQ